MTCHAAIVARELGLPCVVGARDATTTLRDGELVTVDGAQGVVLEGRVDAPGGATGTVAAPATGRTSASAAPSPGHPPLREPRLRRARRGGRRARRRRGRVAAGRVHGDRRPRGGPPPAAPGARRVLDLRRRHGGLAGPDRPGLRAPAGGLPEHRLPIERVLRPRGGRPVRARGEQPDDRLPRVLPLRARARPVPAGTRRCWPGCSSSSRTSR